MNKLYEAASAVSSICNESIDLAKRLLVDSIWKSANIEGLGTSYPRTQAILEHANVNTNASELLFVLNMKHAWEFLFDIIEPDMTVSFSMLSQINSICGYELWNNAGILRTSNVSIGGTKWIPSIPTAGKVLVAISQLNGIEDPIEKALKYFSYLTRAQIFYDGNKRLSQLVCNYILMQNNCGILSIPVDRVEEFYGILLRYYESGNDEELHKFLLENIITM